MSVINVDRLHPAYIKAAAELRDNPGQWSVYESKGNCVVLAGPGSGKTRVLTVKMARMICEDVCSPRGMACITYNSECARELKRRLERLGVTESRNVFIGTIHAFCLKNILLPYARLTGVLPASVEIAPLNIQESSLARALEIVGINDAPSRWKSDFDRYRRTFLDRTAVEWLETNRNLARVIEEYEQILREKSLIDFDDMVLIGLNLVEQYSWIRTSLRARFPIIVIDEYQDLGLPLHRIVLSLMNEGVRILAVGDPDQSIYGFAGAYPELLVQLGEIDGISKIVLPFNYRSSQSIIKASEIVLGEKRGYEAKKDHRGIIEFHECPEGINQQAELICGEIIPKALRIKRSRTLGEIAVLYVDKHDGNIIANGATTYGYDFIRIDGNAPYSKTPLTRWLEDCASWCSGGWKSGTPKLSSLLGSWLVFNKSLHDDRQLQVLKVSLIRFLWSHRNPETPLHDWLSKFKSTCLDYAIQRELDLRLEEKELMKLLSACQKGGSIDNFTLATFAGQGGSPNHLNLITLHSAKGLEFDVVIMMGMDQGKIPSWTATTERAKKEPRRLFYVGVTRAKSEMHMTYSGWTINSYGRRFNNGPSEFLLELRQKLEE